MGCCFSYLINLCNDEPPSVIYPSVIYPSVIYPSVPNYTVESFHTTRYPSRGIYYRLCVEYDDNLL